MIKQDDFSSMRKICFWVLPIVVLSIAVFLVNKLIKQDNEDTVIEIAVDRIIERQAQEYEAEIDQKVQEYFQDTTIQVMDYEKSILKKDSIRFFYDLKADMFILLPDKFGFEVSSDSSMLLMKSDIGIIMIDVHTGDGVTLKERYESYLQKWMKEYKVSIEETNMSSHEVCISGRVKSLSDPLQSYFFYRKWINRDADSDLSIYFLIFRDKREEAEKYIETVIKIFPERPF